MYNELNSYNSYNSFEEVILPVELRHETIYINIILLIKNVWMERKPASNIIISDFVIVSTIFTKFLIFSYNVIGKRALVTRAPPTITLHTAIFQIFALCRNKPRFTFVKKL